MLMLLSSSVYVLQGIVQPELSQQSGHRDITSKRQLFRQSGHETYSVAYRLLAHNSPYIIYNFNFTDIGQWSLRLRDNFFVYFWLNTSCSNEPSTNFDLALGSKII